MKKNIVLILAAFMSLAMVSGCNAEETKTVEWYLAPENKDALDAKIKECRNNPGELWDTPNCVNARRAAEKKMLGGKFKKVKEPAIPTF
ncbi:EexN family lipoprotein [Desulfovibrio sp. OttesenSCG-928-I05]|nr:EexN family lipoprotein [Desulfovibrio sp. OttesenSCG-928-I05]